MTDLKALFFSFCLILTGLTGFSNGFFFLFPKKYDPFEYQQYTDFYGQYRQGAIANDHL